MSLAHKPDKSLLNGSSLAHLTGAVPSAKIIEEVRFPSSSMGEVMSTIKRLGHTGKIEINIHKGNVAGEIKFISTRDTR